ncbi:MAG: hypothetical protein LBD21_03640 [Tannerellaceae bacterium]|jgi:hypothetical protein|nr:hypothetical protein [Tannerellaceae bacterium]
MEINESNGIVPAVTPAWPECTAAAANGIYMLTANYAVNGAKPRQQLIELYNYPY